MSACKGCNGLGYHNIRGETTPMILNVVNAKGRVVYVTVAGSLPRTPKQSLGTTVEIAMGTRIIGIDPGMGGGIAEIWEDGTIDVCPMPIESEIAERLETPSLMIPPVVYIEDIPKGMAGGINGSAMAKLHRNYGFCLGVLSALHIRTVLVRPQVWQKGIPGVQGKKGVERKRALKDHACRLFPNVKVTLKNADALLIAEYGRRDSNEG